MEKNLSDKEKIKQFLEYKGISKNKFYVQTGLSVGFLDSGNSLGVDRLRTIVNIYPDLNIEWVVTGEGSMTKTKQSTANSSALLEIIKEKDARIEKYIRENERLSIRVKQLESEMPNTVSASSKVGSSKGA